MQLTPTCLAFLCLISCAIAAQYLPWRLGRCLSPSTAPNFNVNQFFSGKWYGVTSFGNFLFQGNGICPTLASRVTGNGRILIKTYNYSPELNLYFSIDGSSSTMYSNGQGYLPVTFYGLGFLPVSIPFYIVATDYTTWAVIYSCQQRLLFKSEMSFVLNRKRGSSENMTEAYQSVRDAGLNTYDYVPAVTEGCGLDEPTV